MNGGILMVSDRCLGNECVASPVTTGVNDVWMDGGCSIFPGLSNYLLHPFLEAPRLLDYLLST